MGNMACGCGGKSSILVVNTTVKKYPLPKYETITLDVNQIDESFLIRLNLNYCSKYNIGPFMYINSTNQTFENLFQSEIDEQIRNLSNKINYPNLNEFGVINKRILNELNEFLQSDNYKQIFSLEVEDIKHFLKYSNNNLFRIAFYHRLLKEINLSSNFSEEKTENKERAEKNKKQIELDVYRTFPNLLISTDSEYSKNVHSILYEISIRNKGLGYTQGMNFIIAFILLNIGNDINESYFFFSKILSLKSQKFRLTFEYMFQEEFPLLFKYNDYFMELLKKYYKDIYDKIIELSINSLFWVSKWFQLLFLNAFPFEIVIKLWDIILIYGLDSLITISLVVCEVLRKKIIKCERIEQFFKVINNGKIIMNQNEYQLFFQTLFNYIDQNKLILE